MTVCPLPWLRQGWHDGYDAPARARGRVGLLCNMRHGWISIISAPTEIGDRATGSGVSPRAWEEETHLDPEVLAYHITAAVVAAVTAMPAVNASSSGDRPSIVDDPSRYHHDRIQTRARPVVHLSPAGDSGPSAMGGAPSLGNAGSFGRRGVRESLANLPICPG